MKFLKNKFGFSLVEAMVAIGIVSVAGVVVMKVTEQSKESQQAAKKSTQVTGVNFRFLESAKMILTQTQKQGTANRTEGLCKIIDVGDGSGGVAEVIRPGVSPINIKLENITDILNDDARTARFLGEWREVGGSKNPPGDSSASIDKGQETWSSLISKECSGVAGKYNKCFVMDKADGSMTQTLVDDMKVVVSWRTIPINMNPIYKYQNKTIPIYASFINTGLEEQWIDVKNVGFLLDAKLSFYVPAGQEGKWRRVGKSLKDFFWTGGLGYCDKMSNVEVPYLDSTGVPVADLNGNTIYGIPKKGTCGPHSNSPNLLFKYTSDGTPGGADNCTDGMIVTDTEQRFVKLSLSGTSAADENGLVVINRNGFGGNTKDPVEVIYSKGIAQSGSIDENGLVATNTNENIAVSCNEKKFVCANDTANREYEAIEFGSVINYNSPNIWTNDPSIRMGLNMSIVKGTPSGSSVPTETATSDASKTNVLIRQGRSNGDLQGGANDAFALNKSHNFVYTIHDTADASSANNVCREICSAAPYNDPNFSTNDAAEYYRAHLFYVGLEQSKVGRADADDTLVGCTSCYMKNCKRYGIGTFGPRGKLPTNPEDVAVPECNLKGDNWKELKKMDPYVGLDFSGTDWGVANNQCVKGNFVTGATTPISYSPGACDNEELNVMCFNYGKHLLARDISSVSDIGSSNTKLGGGSVTTSYSSVKAIDAVQRCIEMGREIIQTSDLDSAASAEVRVLFQSNLPKDDSDLNYDFINLAQQGTFLGPQLSSDYSEFEDWLVNERGDSSYSNEFWVGLVKDGKSHIMGAPPIIEESMDANIHAVYYDQNRLLNYQALDHDFGRPVDKVDGVMVLIHSVRYKGVRFIKRTDADGVTNSYKWLCKNLETGKFTATESSGSDWSDGVSKCASIGLKFLPPLSPLQWTDALLALTPNHDSLPFPDPTSDTVASTRAFVGFENIAGARYSSLDETGIIGSTDLYLPSKLYDNNMVAMRADGKLMSTRPIYVGNAWSASDFIDKDSGSFTVTVNSTAYTVTISNATLYNRIGDVISAINSAIASSGAVAFASSDNKIVITMKNGGLSQSISVSGGSSFNLPNRTSSFTPGSHKMLCTNSSNSRGYTLNTFVAGSSACPVGSRKLGFFDVAGSEVFKQQWIGGISGQLNNNNIDSSPVWLLFDTDNLDGGSAGLATQNEIDRGVELGARFDSTFTKVIIPTAGGVLGADIDNRIRHGNSNITQGSASNCVDTDTACVPPPPAEEGSGSGG